MPYGITAEDGYLPRIADNLIAQQLQASGAIHIKGPKWRGKTSSGERASRSQVYLQDPDRGPALLALADSMPSALLQGYMQDAPSDVTVSNYVDALGRAYITADLPAWNPNLRSKTAVRTSPTRHFCDPSIAAAVLGVTPKALLGDFETFGLLFESLCVRDLRVYASALQGRVSHYRDKTGLEADAVVSLPDGRWAPIEVKMGQSRIDEGAKSLLKLADRVDVGREGRPAFLMVLTSTASAYIRPDGVVVVPLACLGV